jgi:hypothetical protein
MNEFFFLILLNFSLVAVLYIILLFNICLVCIQTKRAKYDMLSWEKNSTLSYTRKWKGKYWKTTVVSLAPDNFQVILYT